jgi:hypothetical protein
MQSHLGVFFLELRYLNRRVVAVKRELTTLDFCGFELVPVFILKNPLSVTHASPSAFPKR